MHAFLVVGGSQESRLVEAEKLAKKEQAKTYIVTLQKIADAKSVRNLLKLGHNNKTAYVIYDIDESSPEAANAFLKQLEEPQENVRFILTAKTSVAVLPTIVSRCTVIYSESKLDPEKFKRAKEFIDMPQTEKLMFINTLSKRQHALEFVENFLECGSTLIREKPTIETSSLLQKALTTRLRLKGNANPFLQMLDLAISDN